MPGSLGSYVRQAEHAGSWYTDAQAQLSKELRGYLSAAHSDVNERVCGVISPHAGYAYSGPTAAWGYQYLLKALHDGTVKRIFVLHPSHKVYLAGGALSGATRLETPIGPLSVDLKMMEELLMTGNFEVMTQKTDENEHSAELQLPYIKYCMLEANVELPIVPIIIGATDATVEKSLGQLLSKYCADSSNFFVISSDFCHWGHRFQFTPGADKPEPHRFIEEMDKEGMQLIEKKDPESFLEYLQRTGNTICGRHPISVYLHALPRQMRITFVQYAQSSPVMRKGDSSVSYAAAVVTCP